MTDGTFSLGNLPQRRTPRRIRRGRGNARKGSYSGRGIKGQKARTGGRRGITKRSLKHLVHRVPKLRGFKSFYPVRATITIAMLEHAIKRLPQVVTPAVLRELGLLDRSHGVRIVGTGTLSKPLRIKAHGFSQGAETAILKAGGTPSVIAVVMAKPNKAARAKAKKV